MLPSLVGTFPSHGHSDEVREQIALIFSHRLNSWQTISSHPCLANFNVLQWNMRPLWFRNSPQCVFWFTLCHDFPPDYVKKFLNLGLRLAVNPFKSIYHGRINLRICSQFTKTFRVEKLNECWQLLPVVESESTKYDTWKYRWDLQLTESRKSDYTMTRIEASQPTYRINQHWSTIMFA